MMGDYPEHLKIFLPPALYEAAERKGLDMRYYSRTEMLPTEIYSKNQSDATRRG